MIRYHHGKLQSYIWQPFIAGLLILDLLQILFQMVLINYLIQVSGNEIVEGGEDGRFPQEEILITYDKTARTNSIMMTILVLSATQIVLIGQRFIMIIKRIYFNVKIKEKSNPIDMASVCFGFLWEIIILGSRVVVVMYSILFFTWS